MTIDKTGKATKASLLTKRSFKFFDEKSGRHVYETRDDKAPVIKSLLCVGALGKPRLNLVYKNSPSFETTDKKSYRLSPHSNRTGVCSLYKGGEGVLIEDNADLEVLSGNHSFVIDASGKPVRSEAGVSLNVILHLLCAAYTTP